MRILILGAAGFIGRNLVENLIGNMEHELYLFDRNSLQGQLLAQEKNCHMIFGHFSPETDFNNLTKGMDIVYHLISTTLPNTSMKKVSDGIRDNVMVTAQLLEACAENKVGKIVFLSSGGTVYGLSKQVPFHEGVITMPISAYGMQKIAIEKLLYLYYYTYGMDYRIIRLANTYGRYKRPDGVQGVIASFLYRALRDEEICVYGDGKIVRDYIYIDDAISAIKNITKYDGEYKIFNVGSGIGTSVNEIICVIERILGRTLNVRFEKGRKADVPINILDISRYEENIGQLIQVTLEEGIRRTMKYYGELNRIGK